LSGGFVRGSLMAGYRNAGEMRSRLTFVAIKQEEFGLEFVEAQG